MPASSVRIVTDTTAALPAAYAAAHSVEVVPQVVIFGEESFLEDVQLPYAEFIRRLKVSPALPKTAAPTPGDVEQAYRRQFAAGARSIISIHPSAEVSGTVRSAQTARDDAFPAADIRILDTRAIAGNLATLVMRAVEWAEGGMSADDIVGRLRAMIPRGRTYFLVSTLEYLQKGGRIGGAAALIGTALQIKPILELKDGRVAVAEKVRTQRHAYERLKELAIAQFPRSSDAHLCVMHADDLDAARRLTADLQAATGLMDIPIYSVGAAITTHAGPGTLAVGFFV